MTLLVAIIILIVNLRLSLSGQRPDHLEPEEGSFAGRIFEPYDAAVAVALLGEHNFRKCQMLIIPSFSPENVVYVVRERGASAKVIAKQLEQNLWAVMNDVLSDGGRANSYEETPEAQQRALGKIDKKVKRWEREIDQKTADDLEKVWRMVLSRVQYGDNDTIGLDGETYHIAHFERGIGYRTGTTWSPSNGSLLARFVQLGSALRDFARGELTLDAIARKANQVR
jgi:hypothetical protein